jgi:hypothetical protein
MDKYIELGSNENKIVFGGGYDTSTLLLNTLPIMVNNQELCIITWYGNSPPRGHPYPPDELSSSVG